MSFDKPGGLSTADKKAAIRSHIRALRRELTDGEIRAASISAAARIISVPAFSKAKLLLSYKPAKNEIDPSEIDLIAQREGKRVAYPLCIESGGLRLFVPKTPDAFSVGRYGILEPDISKSDEVFAEDLDLIIAPGIAFDSACARLGQGGGYYDRLLKKTRAYTVGIGYDFQIIADIPHEAHDIALDCVITPSALYSAKDLKTE